MRCPIEVISSIKLVVCLGSGGHDVVKCSPNDGSGKLKLPETIVVFVVSDNVKNEVLFR